MRGISAPSALVFGVFEFAFYWVVVLLLAHGVAVGLETREPPGT